MDEWTMGYYLIVITTLYIGMMICSWDYQYNRDRYLGTIGLAMGIFAFLLSCIFSYTIIMNL